MKYRIKARIKKSDDNIVEFNVLARKLPTEVLSVASADLPEHVLSEIKGWGDRREHIVRGELDLLAENPTVSNWDTVKKVETVGHQAPKGLRGDNRFSRVDIRGDFAYCVSHNFVYNPEVEEEKLYNAKPCYYTDGRTTQLLQGCDSILETVRERFSEEVLPDGAAVLQHSRRDHRGHYHRLALADPEGQP